MRLKLDENLGHSVEKQFTKAGLDVTTVAGQDMCGSSDNVLIKKCKSEGRCIVTLDMGFANPINYPPKKYASIVAIRLSKNQSPEDIQLAVDILAQTLLHKSVDGQLWVIQRDRIRQYHPENN